MGPVSKLCFNTMRCALGQVLISVLTLLRLKTLLPQVMGNGVCLSALLQNLPCGEFAQWLPRMCGRMTSLVSGTW